MARHEVNDLVRLLDKENNGTVVKIKQIEDWHVLGSPVKAYTLEADSDETIKWGGEHLKSMIYLDGQFEAL